ncbi:MAG: hypothetical protein AAF432_01780 [Planctomycetota bacterium]
MQFDLFASTDVAEYVIFDPTLIEPVDDELADFEAILSMASTSGKALRYGSDHGATFRFVVNEVPPVEWLEQSDCGVENALLRVPSGRLMVAGAEDVLPTLQAAYANERSVPPGNYEVDAFCVNWDSDEEDDRVRALIGRRTASMSDAVESLVGIGLFGMAVAGTLSIVAAILQQTLVPLKVTGILLGGYWALLLPVMLLPPIRRLISRAGEARQTVQSDMPSIVVWMRSTDQTSTSTSGVFGAAFVPPKADDTPLPRDRMTLRQWVSNCITIALIVLAMIVLAALISVVTLWVT